MPTCQLGGDHEAGPEYAGGVPHPIWPGITSGTSRKKMEDMAGKTYELPCLACCHPDPDRDQQWKMNEWMDG